MVGFPRCNRGPSLDEARRVVLQAASDAGRDPASLGMDGRVTWSRDSDELAKSLRSWADAGATHVSINTMGAGLKTVDDHLDALAAAAEVANIVS